MGTIDGEVCEVDRSQNGYVSALDTPKRIDVRFGVDRGERILI